MGDLTKLKGRPKIKKVKSTEEGQLKIVWTEVEGAEKYAVLRRDEPHGDFVRVKWREKLSFKDTVEPYKTYWYKISAYKKLEGKKASTRESGIRAGIISDIEPVENVNAVVDGKSILLSWDKDENAVRYIVSRKNEYFSETLPVEVTEKTSYKDKKIVPGVVYQYCVQSVYADGETEKESKFSKKVNCVYLDSGKILARKTRGRKTEFALRLVAGATGYILERAEGKSGEFSEVARTDSNLKMKLTDKAPDHFKAYSYRVRSYRKVKEEEFYSAYGEIISVKTK